MSCVLWLIIDYQRFQELVQLTPSDYRVLYNLGALYVDTSQYDKAEWWFKKTLEVTYCWVITQGDTMNSWLIILQVNPSHEKAAYILGALYSQRNDCDTAISYLLKVRHTTHRQKQFQETLLLKHVGSIKQLAGHTNTRGLLYTYATARQSQGGQNTVCTYYNNVLCHIAGVLYCAEVWP